MSDLSLQYGSRRILDVAVTDDAGDAIDVTGSAFHFTVKADWLTDDADAVISLSVGDGIEVTGAAGGLAEITINEADWSSIANEPAQFIYGLSERDSSDRVWRLATGTLLVTPAALGTVPS